MTELSAVNQSGRGRTGLSIAMAVALAVLGGACGSSKPATTGGGQGGNGGDGPNGDAGNSGAAGGGNGNPDGGPLTGGGGRGVGGAGVGGTRGMGGAMAACMPAVPVTTGTAATVTVNVGSTGRVVSPDLMGVHTSVYDSYMQADTTPWLLQDAGVKSLRYPGGSYSDLYHWETNTGTSTPASGLGSNTIYIATATDFGSFVGFMSKVEANALITVNYGMNPAGTGPGVPQEAAAWVAYANGSATSTTVIGVDVDGVDWKTVGYWAGLRGSAPLPVDDGKNFLRISHPAPVGIKYWEIGNEIYGNGFYFGGCGWEADVHLPYVVAGTTCTGRLAKPELSPQTYGAAVKAYSIAMKAVDPTIKIGGIVAWPNTSYSGWNAAVLTAACANMDFAVLHWYAGRRLQPIEDLLTVPEADITAMYGATGAGLRAITATPAYACPANIPIAVTEWGPNTLTDYVVIPPSTPAAAPVGSQVLGLFAVESYANFMEQGALAVHWLELHNNSYLANPDPTDPFTFLTDSARWGYHGQEIAHHLASGDDTMLAKPVVTNAGALQNLLKVHAAQQTNGGISVMITNTSPSTAANVTLNLTGGSTALACVGVRWVYSPMNGNQDGTVTSDWTFSATDGLSVPVAVPAYSSVVVTFPKR